MARIRYLCVHTNLTSVVDPEGYKTYSGSGSNYEFLEFPILPILFKHIEKLLKMNISISIKKKNLSTICDFIFQTTVRYVPVLQSYSTVYQQSRIFRPKTYRSIFKFICSFILPGSGFGTITTDPGRKFRIGSRSTTLD